MKKKTSKNMGRPKLSKEQARKTMFTVRLKEQEKAEISEIADSQGIRPSEWARKALLTSLKNAKRNT